jgi:hypothetical protein
LNETLTPDLGPYNLFPRSTGINLFFPLETSAQADALYGPETIEPDKGGIAGYALVMLYSATGIDRYLDSAVRIFCVDRYSL